MAPPAIGAAPKANSAIPGITAFPPSFHQHGSQGAAEFVGALANGAVDAADDLERIGDYAAKGIAARCHRLARAPARVRPLHAIPRMAQLVQGMVKDALDAYVERDADKAVSVWRRDDEIDLMYDGLVRELLTYMMEDARNISACIDLMFIAKNLERIGDHATNICEQIRYIVHGERINRMPAAVE